MAEHALARRAVVDHRRLRGGHHEVVVVQQRRNLGAAALGADVPEPRAVRRVEAVDAARAVDVDRAAVGDGRREQLLAEPPGPRDRAGGGLDGDDVAGAEREVEAPSGDRGGAEQAGARDLPDLAAVGEAVGGDAVAEGEVEPLGVGDGRAQHGGGQLGAPRGLAADRGQGFRRAVLPQAAAGRRPRLAQRRRLEAGRGRGGQRQRRGRREVVVPCPARDEHGGEERERDGEAARPRPAVADARQPPAAAPGLAARGAHGTGVGQVGEAEAAAHAAANDGAPAAGAGRPPALGGGRAAGGSAGRSVRHDPPCGVEADGGRRRR